MLRLALRGLGHAMLVTDAMPPVGGSRGAFRLCGKDIAARDGRVTTEDGVLAGSALDMASAVRNCVRLLGIEPARGTAAGVGHPGRFSRARRTDSAASRRAAAPTSSRSTPMRSGCSRPGSPARGTRPHRSAESAAGPLRGVRAAAILYRSREGAIAAGQMAEKTGRRVGVIGAGMVGVCAARWLQRDGHSVFLIEPGNPGEGASFGNAGCVQRLVGDAGRDARRDPQRAGLADGPARAAVAALELSADDPALSACGMLRRRRRKRCGRRRARCGRWSRRPCRWCANWRATPAPRSWSISAAIFTSTARPRRWRRTRFAWALRRENGVEVDEFDADELRQLEPALSREYVRGLLVRENGHTSNPLGLVTASCRAVPARGRRDRAGAGARVPPRRQPADRDPRPMPATCRPMPRSSAPAPIRSRSPRRSATRCRSKPSAAIT